MLTDTHFPGWRASVEGVPTPIYRANALYRAIRVPAGARQVVFEYTPRSLRWGAALSLASLAATAAVPFAARRRKPRREH